MKRIFAMLLILTMLFVSTSAQALPSPVREEDETVTFIVEVEGNPALLEKQIAKSFNLEEVTSEILSDQARVLSQIRKEVSSGATSGYVYTALFNGFSIEGKQSELDALKQIEGVKNVYIAQKTPIYEPMLSEAGALTAVSEAYAQGFGGEGQVIAVVDIYCDTAHDFFQTAPKNPKYSKSDIDNILKTRELNSKAESANQVYKNAKIPYAFNYATNSADTYSSKEYHGTHVAGIAAGKDGTLPDGTKFSGVACEAQLLFMNAGENGYLYDDMIFAAINDAALLEADVINMSFGSDYTDSAIANGYKEIVENARKSGISVVASAGNSSRGFDDNTPLTKNIDYSTVGTPGGTEAVTAVASADNVATTTFSWSISLKDGGNVTAYAAYDNSTFDDLIKEAYVEYEYCNLGTAEDFSGKNLSGKIALVDRGEITFAEKANNAAKCGAIGLIIANTDNSVVTISEVSLPAAFVTNSTGETLKAAEQKAIKFIADEVLTEAVSTGGKISSFSSWGVDTSLNLKPEITAPGGGIYSACPDNKYVSLSGTSMSSPYFAGISAIEREYYETNPFAEAYNGLSGESLVDLLENLAMSSAEIIRYDSGLPYSPRVQGAGLVNMKNLFKEKVLLTGNSEKAKLSLGEIDGTFDISFKITNISKETVKFDKISLELLTDGYKTVNGENYVGESVKLSADSVTLPKTIILKSGAEFEFTASVQLSEAFIEQNREIFTNGFFVDGFVVLDSKSGENYASMPFTGFLGDWYNMPIFDKTVYDEGGSALADADYPYSTGTYLKAYLDNGNYYYVGRNAVDNSIADKKYISFSSNGGLTLGFSGRNYRTVYANLFAILNSDGTVVYNQATGNLCNKFKSYNYKFSKAKTASLSEGEYTIMVAAATNGSEAYNDVLTLPLVIDNTAPEIVSALYDKTAKTVTVSAKDNHYLSFICLSSGSKERYVAVYDADISDGIVTKTIDVSGFSSVDDMVVSVCDYAMNYSEQSLKALTDKIGVEIEELSRLSGVTSAKLFVRNNSKSDVNADVIIAFYGENDLLLATSIKKNQTLKVGGNEVPYSMLCDTQKATSLRAFIWQPSGITPIDTSKKFILAQ